MSAGTLDGGGSKAHLRIDRLRKARPYKGQQAIVQNKFRRENRDDVGRRLLEQIATAFSQADAEKASLGVTADIGKAGTYVSVDRPAKLPQEKLQLKKKGILVGAVTELLRSADGETLERIAYFIPDDMREELKSQIEQYRDSAGANKPNAVHRRFDEVEAFGFNGLGGLWTSRDPLPKDDEVGWFELWLRRKATKAAPDAEAYLDRRKEALGLHVSNEKLLFPEFVVRFVKTKGRSLRRLAMELNVHVAEIRPARIDASVFTTVRQDGVTPDDWVEEALRRLQPPPDRPYVTLHDTGANRAHPLLQPLLDPNDLHARDQAWSTDDHDGHGTNMAGIAVFGDLQFRLQDGEPIRPTHRLESYKVLPPRGENPPETYGLVVRDAIAALDVAAPGRERIHCCTVTARPSSTGAASTWSAAIDAATSGASEIGDIGPRRLWVQAVGNILPHEWSANEDLLDHPVQDPAQAWNALAVGGFTERSQISEAGYRDWEVLADTGDRSPYSRSSLAWERGQTPQKPEIVFEAGNWAKDPAGGYLGGFNSLAMLTTGRDVINRPLEFTEMTSPATARAAGLAAEILGLSPGLWPETVRALMVHAAEWTPAMQRRLGDKNTMEHRAALIRQFGFGVPNRERALASVANDIALVAEAEIKPFRRLRTRNAETGDETVRTVLNEAHYYALPWPRGILEDHFGAQVSLKVALSWFVEPNPGAMGSRYPNVYRSYGLSWDLQRTGESEEVFLARTNAAEHQGDDDGPNDTGWMLGRKNSRAGSLLCDVWTGDVASLLDRRMICVRPLEGWWKTRTKDKRYNDKGRYALVVSLSAPTLPVDVHAALAAEIDALIAAMTPIEVVDA
jgi:hypothetical protein